MPKIYCKECYQQITEGTLGEHWFNNHTRCEVCDAPAITEWTDGDEDGQYYTLRCQRHPRPSMQRGHYERLRYHR